MTAVIFIALLIEAGFNALIPLSIRFFFDRALLDRTHGLLYLMAGVLAVGAVIAVLTGLFRDFLWARVQSLTLAGMRQSVFERIQRLAFQSQTPAFHSQSRAEDLLDRFSNDFASIENTVVMAIPWGVLPAIECLLSTGLMVWLDWRAGLTGL